MPDYPGKSENKKNILIVAGGTGGHISPGIALAEAFSRSEHPVSFLSLEKNRTYPAFADADFPVDFYRAPVPGGFKGLLLFLLRFPASLLQALRVLNRRDVGGVVAMGGYPVLPAAFAALFSGRPLFLCEQNAVHGKATRFLQRFAAHLFLSFPDSTENSKTTFTGNPLRSGILSAVNAPVKKADKKKLKVLVLGGSQGAVQLNEMVLSSLDKIDGIEWKLQCGEGNLAAVADRLKSLPANLRPEIFGFHNAIFDLYKEADVLVCRAGAGVVTEAACFGLPMVLVPYPFATDNHQDGNATVFEKEGAAFVLRTKKSDPENLIACLAKFKEEPELRRTMGEAARKLAKPDAADHIKNKIIEMLEGRK